MKILIKNFINPYPLEEIRKLFFLKSLCLILIIGCSGLSTDLKAQTNAISNQTNSKVTLGIKGGYDYPLFSLPFKELEYKGDRYLGAHLDYQFSSKWGFRLDYANIKTRPNILIPDSIYYGLNKEPAVKNTMPLKRQFVGIGPTYATGNSRWKFLVSPMIGYAWLSGGDASATSMDTKSLPGATTDLLLINTGFNDQVLSAKLDLDLSYAITDNISLTLGAYYLRHFGVHFDTFNDLGYGNLPIAHGEAIFDHSVNPYTFTNQSPNIITNDPTKNKCKDLSSVGLTLGLDFTFGKKVKSKIKEPPCLICPDGKNKVVVTVRDELSKKIIPNADVAIKNMQGNIIATGTTNSFGAADFGGIQKGDYLVTGNVYGIETTIASISNDEFLPNAIIQEEVLYTDLRFILKGKTLNRDTRGREPNVIVSLTNVQTRNVQQDNSDGNGAFGFRLDKNASYELVGNKANRLSDIEKTSTVGLTRSTTLFVDLELEMDDFDCNHETLLDIKYELAKHRLTPSAKFELDRLVQYMKDHQTSRIVLGSHTDCRGNDTYNYRLSRRRAQSAATYIASRGINQARIISEGHGERRLLNRCDDGVNCSESEHRVNRRTEAKLICE